jgi:Ca-activated chloride channel family protein
MIENFHFLRPWWLIALLPLVLFCLSLWQKKSTLSAWFDACDPHLLKHLIQQNKGSRLRQKALLLLLIAGTWLVIALAGPSWVRLPVPTYQQHVARVVILDMSEAMLEKDIKPDRLTRAKFKLHDLFSRKEEGQFALVVFTEQPFVVTPLTEDSNTIDTMLDMLQPDIMPVGGQRLDTALEESAKLIQQAGFSTGQLLVLTASLPDSVSLQTAENLASQGIYTSILPFVADKSLLPLFEPLARRGKGMLLPFSDKDSDLEKWLRDTQTTQQQMVETNENVPIWKDEGRWFLIPALFLLLPVFRRFWLLRV